MTDIKGLGLLEKLGINIAKRVVYENSISKNPPFKECSLRLFSKSITDYKQVANALNTLKLRRIVEDYSLSNKVPVFIYFLKPCRIKELVEELNLKDFIIEAYDVTSQDVLASVIIKKDRNRIYFEGENKGKVRRITREGVKEFWGLVDGQSIKIEGILLHKEIYEFFKYLVNNFDTFPDGLIEFTIHQNPHGIKNQKFVAWEYLKL